MPGRLVAAPAGGPPRAHLGRRGDRDVADRRRGQPRARQGHVAQPGRVFGRTGAGGLVAQGAVAGAHPGQPADQVAGVARRGDPGDHRRHLALFAGGEERVEEQVVGDHPGEALEAVAPSLESAITPRPKSALRKSGSRLLMA
ncbi:DUF1589 domain-containing protein [Phytohabitans flavus]|uniref:DUF1589 domain-containing protein n=1 Tax=Phytohabitans flavus TaxID=1076124 RepID=UPI003627A991